MNSISRYFLIFLLTGLPLQAQNGDRKGETQADLPADLDVPPAPVLSAEDQLKTFRLPPGFTISLVAAEPLVVDPVALAFDEEGRLWIAEMRGYMPDAEGNGEKEPTGYIAVLEDTDGDGLMDKRTEFLSDLVLPRAVQPTRGGALVIAPPDLIFARDTDGDGVADEREVIDTGLAGIPNPEHAINGLDPTLDGWFRVANEPWEYGYRNGAWKKRVTRGGGQWGMTHDDEGLAYFNTNSDPLRGDLIPSHYAVRNPSHGTIGGANVGLVSDRSVYPARINPGVNRGYQPATLRDDFTLAKNTGACGPWIYRGAALGDEVQGSAFVCEPTANMVQRFVFEPRGEFGLQAKNAHAGLDFLTSTDERFRPVNLTGGPDGALYIADFARGLIQHRIYLTSFLRKQAEERGLVEPHALGRIWRVTRDTGSPGDSAPAAFTPMSTWSWDDLLTGLGSPSGWIRDNAMRVIVEQWEGDAVVLEELRSMASGAAHPLASLHAIWTLHGIDEMTPEVNIAALGHADGRVVRAAMRSGELWLSTGKADLAEAYEAACSAGDARTLRQGLLSLSGANTKTGDRALARLLERDELPRELREAALAGLGGRELGFLLALHEHTAWNERKPGRAEMFSSLARCVVREGVAERIERLLALASDVARPAWQSESLVKGILAARRKGPEGELQPLRLAREPHAALGMGLPSGLGDQLCWPGREGCEAFEVRPLLEHENRMFERGKVLFANVCAGCHRSSGLGDPGLAPQLRDHAYVLGNEGLLIRILSHGLAGPIQVEGHAFDSEMPATGFSSEDMAAVATYIRREWGHGAEPVTPESVRRVEQETAGRSVPWTVAELEALELE